MAENQYEAECAARKARNAQVLQGLGLPEAGAAIKPPMATTSQKRKSRKAAAPSTSPPRTRASLATTETQLVGQAALLKQHESLHSSVHYQTCSAAAAEHLLCECCEATTLQTPFVCHLHLLAAPVQGRVVTL